MVTYDGSHVPIRVMHTDGLLTLQDSRFVNHHTGLMQCGLTIQNQLVTITQMSVDLLVDRRCAGLQTGTC